MSRMRALTGLLNDGANRARKTEFRMRSQISKFVMWFGVLGLASSCAAQHASAVDAKDDELSSETPVDRGEANPNDPFGACVLVDDLTDIIPFDCARGGSCSGYGMGGPCEGRDGEAVCDTGPFYMICENPCDSDDDCPIPLTGSAAPVCHDELCQLPCEDDAECPDGFSCHEARDGDTSSPPRSCVQILDAPPRHDP